MDEIPANDIKTSSSNNRSKVNTDFYAALKRLDKHQLFSLLSMSFILTAILFFTILISKKTNFYIKAQVVTVLPTTPPVNGIPGDANGDSHVDLVDYVYWLNNYGKPSPKGPGTGDFNADNRVDLVDFVVWLNNYGKY